MISLVVLCLVALRKESVDRNSHEMSSKEIFRSSLSARRAWIEILTDDVSTGGKIVALRKESVDRNLNAMQIIIVIMRRSPQGERG